MTNKTPRYEQLAVNSLEKIFSNACASSVFSKLDALSTARRERAAFQIVCRDLSLCTGYAELSVEDSDIPGDFTIRVVGYAPCMMPAHRTDKLAISCEPGLFPDPLLPENRLPLSEGNWRAFWIDFVPDSSAPAGSHDITFILKYYSHSPDNATEEKLKIRVEILDFELPAQKLVNVNWFYADCLASYYKVKPWSERHWRILADYFRDMATHGNNSIYTPLWSVPLDTQVGGERPDCQLLRISCINGNYSFDFSQLERWIDLARSHDIEIFEMSHAFTQWGAKNAPKIIVVENGKAHKKFGWHTAANSEEYRDFLKQLMENLIPFLRQKGVTPENCYFHISDEPSHADMENYRAASEFFVPLLCGYPVIDALSDVEFFRQGLIKSPIPNVAAIDNFVNEDMEARWCYHCGQFLDGVPNRQLGVHSCRNRAWGYLAYLYASSPEFVGELRFR